MITSLSLLKRFAKRAADETDIVIPRPLSSQTTEGFRVSASIDNEQIYFCSADTSLKPISEAFGCSLLIPALHAQRPLTFQAEVCELWARHIAEIVALVEPWWGYSPIDIESSTYEVQADRCSPRALCFSCGVDSFYSLLRYPGCIHALVCVLGYDVKLRDRRRAQALEASLRAVAREHAVQPIVITTNLRRHRLMKQSPWENTHGGALAAIGHLLSDSYGSIVISSSGARIFNRPWGSHWALDPKYGSNSLAVEHFGEHIIRSKKLIEIAEEPAVRKYLRVCWEYRNAEINCGVCEKCIRTMLTLDACGQLGYYTSFGNTTGLALSINRYPHVPSYTIDVYEFLLSLGLSPCFQVPVRNLIERSKLHHYGVA